MKTTAAMICGWMKITAYDVRINQDYCANAHQWKSLRIPIHVWSYMQHSYVWHDSSIRVPWLIFMSDMSRWYRPTNKRPQRYLKFRQRALQCNTTLHKIALSGGNIVIGAPYIGTHTNIYIYIYRRSALHVYTYLLVHVHIYWCM